MDSVVYAVGLITIFALLAFSLSVLFIHAQRMWAERRHVQRVRRAVSEGWEEPRLPRNWTVLGNAALKGVTGVSTDPDQGVPVSEWGKHTAKVQRQVEEAWLAGIEDEKRKRTIQIGD